MEYPPCCGEIDGNHIAMKKPKKSDSDYYNYKGFFSLMVLALVDAEYRFPWVNVGSNGSSSGTKVVNRNDLRETIEDGTLGLPPPEPLGLGRAKLALFFAGWR